MSDLEIPAIPQEPSHKPDGASVFAFMGAVGGAGVTSLALQTAQSAKTLLRANGVKDPEICVIDLDFDCGSVLSHLDLPARLTHEHLSYGAAPIDAALTSALAVCHASDIHVLATAPRLSGNDDVDPSSVLAMMDAASTIYDALILDVPRMWRPWTHAAVAAADHFGLITEMTIPSLAAARSRAESIMDIQSSVKPELILSRYERRALKSNLSAKDATRAFGRAPVATICPDETSLHDAMNCGQPVGCVHADSRYVKDVTGLTAKWLGMSKEQSEPKPRRWRRRAA